MAETTEVYFDTREAAAALDVDQRTVGRWIKSGRLIPLKPTRGFVFSGAEIGRVARLPRPQRGGARPGGGRPRRPAPQRETLPDAS